MMGRAKALALKLMYRTVIALAQAASTVAEHVTMSVALGLFNDCSAQHLAWQGKIIVKSCEIQRLSMRRNALERFNLRPQ
jgi:hypothetical protein